MSRLVLILGDQLSHHSNILNKINKEFDSVAMVEVINESKIVWSHKVRTAFFLSSMRHFAEELKCFGFKVYYQKIDDPDAEASFELAFGKIIKKIKPQRILVIEPGEHRVREELLKLVHSLGLELEILPDESFFCSIDDFKSYREKTRNLRMEYFYREMRKKYKILMNSGAPLGGKWNFDKENRKSFGKSGPPKIKDIMIPPDVITLQVIDVVNRFFPSNPGSLENFSWPVNEAGAKKLLDIFIKEKLPHFGDWQDAMWSEEPFLYHSKISAAMNVKLLSAKYVVTKVEEAYRRGEVSLASAEGFIRQILGWREYVRGVYYSFMPNYLERNYLKANKELPGFYWSGRTQMNCMSQVIKQTLKYGYAHHIQRLMVTGLFSLLYGVNPKRLHEWYLAVYVDAIEWVELPNTLGMSQYADGGVMASKPYIASGKYINRMSNYCKGCKYNPDTSFGKNACPFTTLFWEFVNVHRELLARNPRLGMQVKNWDKKGEDEKKEILKSARRIRAHIEDI